MNNEQVIETEILETKRKDVFLIDPRLIEVEDGFNGRNVFPDEEQKMLKESIRVNGVLVPILVKKVKDKDNERYILKNGERRWRASMDLVNEGLESFRIPATMFTGSDIDAIVSMLVTNDNVPLNLVEEAGVLYRLTMLNLTIKEISTKTGRKANYINNLLKLHAAPQKIKNHIAQNLISPSLAMKIMREEKDYDNAIVIIECAIESVNSSAGKKVTEKDINKAKGVVNSFGELKKAMKQYETNKYVVREDRKEWFKFFNKINKGQLTAEQILAEIFLM